MENYFDIATSAEIEAHFGYMPDAGELAADRSVCERDTDGNFAKLASLYYDRGDEVAARQCLEQIRDPERKLQASMLLYECRLA